MTKIAILFIDSRGDLGGGSAHLLSLLEGLTNDQFDLSVAAPDGEKNSIRYKNIVTNYISISYRKFDLHSFRRLAEFIKAHPIHLIHSHGRGAGIYSRLLGRQFGLPVIHTFHGISFAEKPAWFSPALWFEKWLAAWTTRFVHVSESEQRHGEMLGVSDPCRSHVIPNGIRIDQFRRSETDREKIRKTLGISADEFVIGCVARFDSCKRHQDLLNAVKILAARHKPVKLILIGRGETESLVEWLIQQANLSERVIRLGELDDVRGYYSAFDVFVLPSLAEGLPLTPLEAMASGCPVVLSDVRGNRDLIQNETSGLLVPAHNPAQLADAIERMRTDDALRAACAANALERVKHKWAADQMINQVDELYRSLCPMPSVRRVALVHDWLFHMRGGEKVLQAIAEMFPAAPIFALFLDRSRISDALKRHPIHASWLNGLPGIRLYYRYLLPLFPFVVGQFRTRLFDLLISSSHCVAKGAPKQASAFHVCYCHAPMRYAWGFQPEYFGRFPAPIRRFIELLLSRLRKWDVGSNRGVDQFVANSENVKSRINEFYNREASVIHPPIDHAPDGAQVSFKDYFLVVSAFVPYKRVDVAIDAFNEAGLTLIVIGEGPMDRVLKKKAAANIHFLGWRNDAEIASYYAHCRALVFPTQEDFGMVPVEAMMHGKPVIALGKGGALETVIPYPRSGATGILFAEQTAASLLNALREFERASFDSSVIQKHAQNFSKERFVREMKTMLEQSQEEAVYGTT